MAWKRKAKLFFVLTSLAFLKSERFFRFIFDLMLPRLLLFFFFLGISPNVYADVDEYYNKLISYTQEVEANLITANKFINEGDERLKRACNFSNKKYEDDSEITNKTNKELILKKRDIFNKNIDLVLRFKADFIDQNLEAKSKLQLQCSFINRLFDSETSECNSLKDEISNNSTLIDNLSDIIISLEKMATYTKKYDGYYEEGCTSKAFIERVYSETNNFLRDNIGTLQLTIKNKNF